MNFTAQQISDLLNGEIVGDENASVSDMAKIEEGTSGTITFLANPKYEEFIYTTQSTIALVNKTFTPSRNLPSTLTLIKVDDAYQCLTKLLGIYDQVNSHQSGI